MEITDSYIIKNQRLLMKTHSSLSRHALELSRLGFDSIVDTIVSSMDEIEDTLRSVGVEIDPEGCDEKLIEAQTLFMEIFDEVGINVDGERRLYRTKMRKYLKAKGWEQYQIGNLLRDEPYRPIARLLDHGFIKAHGNSYWTLTKED